MWEIDNMQMRFMTIWSISNNLLFVKYWICNAMSTYRVHFRQKPRHKNKIASLFNRGMKQSETKINCKLMATQLKPLPSSGGQPRRTVINWVSHEDWLLVPAQEETLKLVIVVCGVWTWKLKRPGTHTTEMILVSMVLWLLSFQVIYSSSEE